ncbi:MAG: Mur ligase family protein [Trueperaceae bacterium]
MPAPDPQGAAAQTPNLAWLFGLQRFGARPGLERVRALAADVGAPQDGMRLVLVAGTNGKGSVARTVAACLEESGARTGLFVSPHLQHVGERAQVDGVIADELEMERWVAQVRPHAERLGATFFEVVTVAALLRFAAAAVAWAVMEVGMGGRLDATNAFEPELSLITSVALDHMGVLGDTLEQIAREKAGILRPGVPAVSSAEGTAAVAITEEAARIGAPVAFLGETFFGSVSQVSWDGTTLAFRDQELHPQPLHLVTPLVGRHQAANVALAAAAALRLGIEPEQVVRAVARVRWPGRLERVHHRGRWFVLDGAHNPQAAAALAAALVELEGSVATLVLGMSHDKDAEGVAGPLLPLARRVFTSRAAGSPRALAPDALADVVSAGTLPKPGSGAEPRVRAIDDLPTALAAALDATPMGGTIVVAGSLFLVGEARSWLSGEAAERYERWQ